MFTNDKQKPTDTGLTLDWKQSQKGKGKKYIKLRITVKICVVNWIGKKS